MLPRNPVLIKRARHLRRNLTKVEAKLWQAMSRRQLKGTKFSRQIGIAGYICDFVCREHRLVVEVDGGQHVGSEYDRVRDARIEAAGYRVLRFWNSELFESELEFEHVLHRIGLYLPDPE